MSESYFSENLHISTMVQICKLNSKIELKPLAENLIINENLICKLTYYTQTFNLRNNPNPLQLKYL